MAMCGTQVRLKSCAPVCTIAILSHDTNNCFQYTNEQLHTHSKANEVHASEKLANEIHVHAYKKVFETTNVRYMYMY